jgi:hypothetical protein
MKKAKNKVGRPISNQIEYVQTLVNLSKETNDRLLEMADRSYMSKVGIIRLAIDSLYYSLDNNIIPNDLEIVLNDLKNGVDVIDVLKEEF